MRLLNPDDLRDTRSQLIARLQDKVAFARSSRWRRLLRHPVRFARMAAHRYLPWEMREFVNISTFADDRLRVELSSTSQETYKYGFHEADLTMACLLLVTPGSIFVDIGANFGYFTVLAARLVGSDGRVYSFEPTPRTYTVLKNNVTACRNVVIECVAIASRTGLAILNDYGSEYSGFNTLSDEPRTRLKLKATSSEVATIPLDDYFAKLRQPNFVKIDAENAEMDILAGMERILNKAKPIVSLEVGDPRRSGASQSRALVDFMLLRGYTPYEIEGNRLRRHVPVARYDFANLIFVANEVSRC